MMNKKAQSQIITTVLIILLVLAAIVIVWQVVQTTVEGGADEMAATASCFGSYIRVVSAHSSVDEGNNSQVVITRDAGGTEDAVEYLILIDGEQKDSIIQTPVGKTTLEPLESVTLIFSASDFPIGVLKIQASAMIGEQACGLSTEFTDIEFCGDGIVNGAEECEADGDCVAAETCTNCICGTSTECGNWVIEPGEECDDGNPTSGDGCSNECVVESGWECNDESGEYFCTLLCGNNEPDPGEDCESNIDCEDPNYPECNSDCECIGA